MRVLSLRKKLVFTILTISVCAAVLELLARGVEAGRAWRHSGDSGTAVRDAFHPLRYDLVPGRILPANGAVAHINRAGLRGTEPDAVKQRVRVLCLGDSCTFGYAPDVNDASTYPAALGRLLDPTRFEVLNGGRPGYGSLDVLNFFLYEGVELKPDVVIILAGWNDYGQAHPVVHHPPQRNWLDQLALTRLTRELIGRFVHPRPTPLAFERARAKRLPPPSDRLDDAIFGRTERTLSALVQLCRNFGATPILVTYANFTRDSWQDSDTLNDDEFRIVLPYLLSVELSPRGWRRYATTTNDLIRRVATENHVPLVAGDTIHDPALFVDLVHMKAEGCQALAAQVAPQVLNARAEPTKDRNAARER